MSKKTLFFIVAIASVTLLVAGGYFLYIKFHKTNKPAKEEITYVYEKEFIDKIEKLINVKINVNMSDSLKGLLTLPQLAENSEPSIKDKKQLDNLTFYSIDPHNDPNVTDCDDYYAASTCINFVVDKNSNIILTDLNLNNPFGSFGSLQNFTNDFISFGNGGMTEGIGCWGYDRATLSHYLFKEKTLIREQLENSTDCPKQYSIINGDYCKCMDDKYIITTSSSRYFDINNKELKPDDSLVQTLLDYSSKP